MINYKENLEQLEKEFPHIAFNDDPTKRNKNHYLFQLDTSIISPKSYEVKNIMLYKGVITWNPKAFNQMLKWGANVYKITEYPRLDDTGKMKEFTKLKDKEGICVFDHEVHHDMSSKQLNVFMELNNITRSAYGNNGYGAQYNKNDLVTLKQEKLEILDKHKFCICFENVYHPLWSWNYVTQSIYDCFKAKTMPIYLGAYNIDEIIPPNLYIDYRDFRTIDELREYMSEIDDELYNEVIEKSYQFALYNQYDINKLVKALKNLPIGNK